jgi:hypothetical protein
MQMPNEAIRSTHYIGHKNGRAVLKLLVRMVGITVIVIMELQLGENYRPFFSMGASEPTTDIAPYIPLA